MAKKSKAPEAPVVREGLSDEMTDRRHIPNAWPRGMRADTAAEYVGLSKTGLLAEVKAGRAPRPHRITPGRVIWLKEELDAYLDGVAGKEGRVNDGAGWEDYLAEPPQRYPDPLERLGEWRSSRKKR